MLNTYKKVQIVCLIMALPIFLGSILTESFLFLIAWIIFMQYSFTRLIRKDIAGYEKIVPIRREKLAEIG